MRNLTLSSILLLSLGACGCGSTSSTTSAGDPTPDGPGGSTAVNEAEPREPVQVESGSIAAAIAGAHRSEDNRKRDRFRHPAETLEFFGLEPSMTVVEMAPGGGWYTEVLAPVVRDHGTLVAAIPDPAESEYGQRFVERMEQHPEVFDQVQTVIFDLPERASLGEPGSADMVLTFRSTHGWVGRGQAERVYQAMFDVLRPGGVLGVVQHRADEGADPEVAVEQGYVPEAHVIQLAEAAGFVLEERSEINANPADDHDHPEGVWTLPPSLRLGDADRAEWEAIGESDRMTLRFRKPDGEPATQDAQDSEGE